MPEHSSHDILGAAAVVVAGAAVGACVGAAVGRAGGAAVGTGLAVGAAVGRAVGATVPLPPTTRTSAQFLNCSPHSLGGPWAAGQLALALAPAHQAAAFQPFLDISLK